MEGRYRTRRACIFALSSGLYAATAIAACSGAEEDAGRPRRDAGSKDAETLPVDGAPVGEAAALDVNVDQSVPPPVDGGTAWDFAEPYVAVLGPTSRSAGHDFGNNVPTTNPRSTQCLNCHRAGGTAANRPFFAGGSVKYASDGGPAAMAEVRLKHFYSTNAVSAHTDGDGNWFVTSEAAADAGVTFTLRAGVRNATIVRKMGPSPGIGNCNQCHNGVILL